MRGVAHYIRQKRANERIIEVAYKITKQGVRDWKIKSLSKTLRRQNNASYDIVHHRKHQNEINQDYKGTIIEKRRETTLKATEVVKTIVLSTS